MDDHKSVMISIFFFLLSKHEKDVIFFNENMFENFLRFGRMHENNFFLKYFGENWVF